MAAFTIENLCKDLRREIMQGMISVHREACNCEGTEQLDEFYKQNLEAGIISIISQLGTTIQPKEKTLHLVRYCAILF